MSRWASPGWLVILLLLHLACDPEAPSPQAGERTRMTCPPGQYCVYLPHVSRADGPATRRYFMVVYNPVLESLGGVRLITHQGWRSPDDLAAQYAARVAEVSHGMLRYVPAGRIELDAYPVKEDGFQYTDATFLACLGDRARCHKPDLSDGFGYAIDYPKMLSQTGACALLNQNKIDELWLFSGPFFGMWEANQAGTGAFWTNGPVITGTACGRILNIMGFSCERGLAEMLEDLGHRVEGTMSYFYGGGDHAWARFSRSELTRPGGAECGTVHVPPNGLKAYHWDNQSPVTSGCERWLGYPNLVGPAQTISCNTWGCSAEGYQSYWLAHLPHRPGTGPDGKQTNWWSYVSTR